MCRVKEGDEYSGWWKSWSVRRVGMIGGGLGMKVIKERGIEKEFEMMEKVMEEAEMIMKWGDGGEEGEVMEGWVMEKGGGKWGVKGVWIW